MAGNMGGVGTLNRREIATRRIFSDCSVRAGYPYRRYCFWSRRVVSVALSRFPYGSWGLYLRSPFQSCIAGRMLQYTEVDPYHYICSERNTFTSPYRDWNRYLQSD